MAERLCRGPNRPLKSSKEPLHNGMLNPLYPPLRMRPCWEQVPKPHSHIQRALGACAHAGSMHKDIPTCGAQACTAQVRMHIALAVRRPAQHTQQVRLQQAAKHTSLCGPCASFCRTFLKWPPPFRGQSVYPSAGHTHIHTQHSTAQVRALCASALRTHAHPSAPGRLLARQ